MAKQRKNHDPRCPECGQTHDGMCRGDSFSIPLDDPRRSIEVPGTPSTAGKPSFKRMMGFGNRRS